MTYHPTVDKIKKLLDDNHIDYETFEHKEVRTSEEAAKVRHGYSIEQGAKALILKAKRNSVGEGIVPSRNDSTSETLRGGIKPLPTKTNEYVMIVLLANLRLDNDKVRSVLGVKEMRFATPEEVSQVTSGVLVGGVPPFGNIFGLEVYVDPKLFENERIVFNAGDRCFSIAIKSEDYRRLVPHQETDVAAK